MRLIVKNLTNPGVADCECRIAPEADPRGTVARVADGSDTNSLERVSTTNPAQMESARRFTSRHAAGGVAIAGVVCAALVATLFLLARNAPSSTTGYTEWVPMARVSADEGCENFGRYWTDTSGAGIDPIPLELFTNCRLLDDGAWQAAATMYGAAPLDETTLTDEQRTELTQLRTAIAAQVDGLEAVLPKSIQNAFAQLHTERTNPVVGHFQEGLSWGSYRTRYARIVNAAMLDPKNAELADFIGWIMARKINGYATFRRECLANQDVAMLDDACRGMEDNLSIRYAPLPWDLRDPDLLDSWYYETHVKPTQTEG